MKVGFIGLGNAGGKLAGSLLRNGFDLTVRDLNKKFVNELKKTIPMKRMGTPQDLEEVIKFLLNDNSKYVTGQNILIDGGRTII